MVAEKYILKKDEVNAIRKERGMSWDVFSAFVTNDGNIHRMKNAYYKGYTFEIEEIQGIADRLGLPVSDIAEKTSIEVTPERPKDEAIALASLNELKLISNLLADIYKKMIEMEGANDSE